MDHQLDVQMKQMDSSIDNLEYALLEKSSVAEKQSCYSLAFNNDSSILVVGYIFEIKIFEFQNNNLKLIQDIKEPKQNVQCLIFSKKSNQFISGNTESIIIVWEQNNQNQYEIDEVLTSHTFCINSLRLNKNENLLFSCSSDQTINFWQKINDLWDCIQTIQFQSYVWSIDLDQEENVLISCANDSTISIMMKSQEKWIVIQTINVERRGVRISFIDNDQFVFQPYFVYDKNKENDNFQKSREVSVMHSFSDGNYLFPIQYIRSLNLIFVKNCDFVNIIRKISQDQLILNQAIDFKTSDLYGCVSDDGQYLATWESTSKAIQIRKLISILQNN